MPFGFRADLHERAGADIEATAADAIDLHLDLLAHHYWLSENVPKKCEYLVRAGDAAKANYANEAAIDYLERAAPLLEAAERWRVTRGRRRGARGDRRLAGRREHVSRRRRARGGCGRRRRGRMGAHVARRPRAQARRIRQRVTLARDGAAALRGIGGQGRPRARAPDLGHGRGHPRRLRDREGEARGEPGDPTCSSETPPARARCSRTSASWRSTRRTTSARRRSTEEGLALRIEAGDKGAIAISQMNLGNVLLLQGRAEEARACHEESLQASARDRRPVDDRARRAQPRHPHAGGRRLRRDSRAVRERARRRSATTATSGRSRSSSRTSPCSRCSSTSRRSRFASAARALPCARRRARRAEPADQEELDAQLAPAREALGERADALWEAGRMGGLDEAIRTALRLCERR